MKSRIFIVIAFLSVLTVSCAKELARCILTEAQKEVIPYKKGQVISFSDGAGQTVDFTVTKNEFGWEEDRQGSGYKVDYITSRYNTVKLESEPDNFLILLHISAGNCLAGYACSLEIKISSYKSDFWFSIDDEGNYYYPDPDSIELPPHQEDFDYSLPFFHESIEINNKVYYDVIESRTIRNSLNPYIIMQLYYNKMYGILQIIRDGENFLTINN